MDEDRLIAVSTFAGSFVCYLLLTGTLTWTELAAAVPVASAVGAFTTVQHIRPLVLALIIPALAACRGGTGNRFAALQLTTSVTTIVLAVMTFAFEQSSFIDLALTVPLISLAGCGSVATQAIGWRSSIPVWAMLYE